MNSPSQNKTVFQPDLLVAQINQWMVINMYLYDFLPPLKKKDQHQNRTPKAQSVVKKKKGRNKEKKKRSKEKYGEYVKGFGLRTPFFWVNMQRTVITTQKSLVLIYFAAEASNHDQLSVC